MLIKNDGYDFLIKLDLVFYMSLWKEFQLLEVLNHLSIKNLIILILYENAIRLLKFKRGTGQFAICLKNEILIIVPEMNTSRKAMKCSTCCSIVNLMLECFLFKK